MRTFEEGEIVEVCSKELGFVGSYYEAKVIQRLTPGCNINGYIVEYTNLVVEEEHPSVPLKEVVSSDEVRPLPPKQPARLSIRLGDVVDASDNDGWWFGNITGKTKDKEYYIYFPTTADHIAYPASRLREHMDWCNGHWIFSRKKF